MSVPIFLVQTTMNALLDSVRKVVTQRNVRCAPQILAKQMNTVIHQVTNVSLMFALMLQSAIKKKLALKMLKESILALRNPVKLTLIAHSQISAPTVCANFANKTSNVQVDFVMLLKVH
jgi:hypothetical protein